MSRQILKIIYTSDVHGQLTGYLYATKTTEYMGLSRVQTYLKQQKDPYLLLDNGDILQGNPLLDYERSHSRPNAHLLSSVMNELRYDAITLGNHDFNYGMTELKRFTKHLSASIVCCNITDSSGKLVLQPYVIVEKLGIRVGIIGAITDYIPNWERPEHIQHIVFLDPVQEVKRCIQTIRSHVDCVVVLYHGGLERDLTTHLPIGRPTSENRGYELAHIPGVDLLLTGHQHQPLCENTNAGTLVMQTGMQAKNIGEASLEFEKQLKGWLLVKKTGNIVEMNTPEDQRVLELVAPLHEQTNTYLDQMIGFTAFDLEIRDAFLDRCEMRPLYQWMNQIQLEKSKADVSAVSLPNQAKGFRKEISLRDIEANFIYPNTLVKLQINGHILKQAIERSAEYYQWVDHRIEMDHSFRFPKVEHYNVDFYAGVDYIIDISKPKGHRLVSCLFQGRELRDDDSLSIVLNHYRAVGGGDYPMYKDAIVLEHYDYGIKECLIDVIQRFSHVAFPLRDNFKILPRDK